MAGEEEALEIIIAEWYHCLLYVMYFFTGTAGCYVLYFSKLPPTTICYFFKVTSGYDMLFFFRYQWLLYVIFSQVPSILFFSQVPLVIIYCVSFHRYIWLLLYIVCFCHRHIWLLCVEDDQGSFRDSSIRLSFHCPKPWKFHQGPGRFWSVCGVGPGNTAVHTIGK